MATQGRQRQTTRGRRLGLDELMIVNPVSRASEVCFLGDDGTLYRVQRLPTKRSVGGESGVARRRLFLGENGTVYEVVR